MKLETQRLLLASVCLALCAGATAAHAADDQQTRIKQAVDAAIVPLMAKDDVPGMAVGVTVDGRPWVFDYGVASKEGRQPVTRNTLFELGSVSKTLTATLASYAAVNGELSLAAPAGQYVPALQSSPFGKVSLLELGTHTPGGLPLQVPDDVTDEARLMQYFRAWKPLYAPGTYRTYSNMGIGMLGFVTAKRMGQSFDAAMTRHLLPALGLSSSYLDVPSGRAADYAQGYTKQNQPVRMKPGVLGEEAYGIRSNAADMTRFIEANMGEVRLAPKLQQAITATHTGYFRSGPLTQDLIWEQYPWPVDLKTLQAGNSSAMILDATPATRITPPEPPRDDVWINKTGSTNGFATYIAFIPQRHLGIVLLANKNYPIEDRVAAAYAILSALDTQK
ncbi:class C beta-lactamase [Paraburkholderia sp. B3]|uniref:class C beta-lactamase n=1 Tax=Paraburkholderia sp. B3 TaxID=3134791 RepID=UPI0039827638